MNGKNKKEDSAQTKYRKYYNSGSTLDVEHLDHAIGWELAHNSQRCHFLIRSDSRLSSRQHAYPPWFIFTLSTE